MKMGSFVGVRANRRSFDCAAHDETVSSFARVDRVWVRGEEKQILRPSTPASRERSQGTPVRLRMTRVVERKG